MFKRSLAVSLAVLSAAATTSVADELKAASKGKLENVETYYGRVESFEDGTLAFTMLAPAPIGATDLRQRLLAPPQTMTQTFKSSETELEILLNVSVPQSSVNGSDFASSVAQKTKDVDLQRAQLQQQDAAARRNSSQAPEQRDLRKCSVAGVDQVFEKDSDGNEKPPVSGNIILIENGYAKMKRNSDGQELRYRLEDLSRNVLGKCSV